MTNWRLAFPIALFVVLVGSLLYAIFYPALTGTPPQSALGQVIMLFVLLSPFFTVLLWAAIALVVYRWLRHRDE
jgi:hypothetical protein